MRVVGAVVVALLIALPAAAQNDNSVAAPGITAKPARQTGILRKPAIRTGALRARVTARRTPIAVPPSDAVPAVGEGSLRTTAAGARKRGSAPPGPSRDTSMPGADRLAVQLDLGWTGDYSGLINGEANDRTTAAIKAFQRNHKFKETGVLNTQERAVLAASARARQAQVGWSMVDDPVTGARLGLPTKQVPNKSQGKSGTHWSSAQGQVQVETFRIREPGTTLAAVYEQQKKQPSTRKLGVNLLRPDFFILAGTQNLKKFSVRADIKDGEVRGMTVLYDQATENIMDPVAIVMASAFTAFPGVAGVAQFEPTPKRKVEYGTGIIVSPVGHILTDRQLTDGCNVIVVSGYGDVERQSEDKATDLALLRVYGVPDPVAASFTGDAANGPDLTLIGIADPQSQGGGGAISTAAAKLKAAALDPPPQPGFSGSAALDGEGRIAGMVQLKAALVANIGPSGARPQATLVPAPVIRAFLDGQKLPPASTRSGLEAAKASIVRVICVRK